MMNLVILQGRWVSEGELKDLGNDRKVFNGRIAVQSNYRPENGEPETEFFNVEAWGQRAEGLAQFARKGAMVLIRGRLTINRWRPQDSEYDVERPVIRVEEFQLIGYTSREPVSSESDEDASEETYAEEPEPEPEPAPAPARAVRSTTTSRTTTRTTSRVATRTAASRQPAVAAAGARGGRRPF